MAKQKIIPSEDKNNKTVADVFDSLNDQQKNALYLVIGQIALYGEASPDAKEALNLEIKDMTTEQAMVVYFLIGRCLKEHND